MLEISPTAAEVIRAMIEPSIGIEGIRVALGPLDSPNGNAPGIGVVIAPARGPSEGDRTVRRAGIAVFVDAGAAALLEDKVLDVAPAGADRLRLTFSDQVP
jgi:Fe-S cluster assembly iron-binding protein IscA